MGRVEDGGLGINERRVLRVEPFAAAQRLGPRRESRRGRGPGSAPADAVVGVAEGVVHTQQLVHVVLGYDLKIAREPLGHRVRNSTGLITPGGARGGGPVRPRGRAVESGLDVGHHAVRLLPRVGGGPAKRRSCIAPQLIRGRKHGGAGCGAAARPALRSRRAGRVRVAAHVDAWAGHVVRGGGRSGWPSGEAAAARVRSAEVL